MEGIKFTGKGTPPAPKPINPNTGKPYGRELGRMYMDTSGGVGSGKGSSKTIAPISSSISLKSSPTTESTIKSMSYPTSSLKYPSYQGSSTKPSSKSPSNSIKSSIISPSSKLFSSSSPPASSIRSTTTTPTTRITPPSYTQTRKTPSITPPGYTPKPTYTKQPTYITTPPNIPVEGGGGWLPPGGGRGSPQRGYGLRSAVATHPVGADLLGVSRDNFQPMRMGKGKKPKGMQGFKAPKF